MKTKLTYLLLAALAGTIIYQTFFQRGMLQETLHITYKMDQQLDSLWQIFQAYEQTRLDYEEAYVQLQDAQLQVTQIGENLSRLSAEQEADVLAIREQLRSLTRPKAQWELPPVQHVDSLLFQP